VPKFVKALVPKFVKALVPKFVKALVPKFEWVQSTEHENQFPTLTKISVLQSHPLSNTRV
jgi:hypothetical protein